MKIKILFIFSIIVLFLGGKAESNKARLSNINNKANYYKAFKKDSVRFNDSLDIYFKNIKKNTISIAKSNKAINMNYGYKSNIENKKSKYKDKINELFLDITNEIEKDLNNKKIEYFTDSICLNERGFIGNKIFGKNKCKEWEVKTYYFNKDSVKIYK